MPKPACLKCQRFYRCKKTGFMWLETMPIDYPAEPGTVEPEKWAPYKIWHSDLYECQGCGHQLIVGHGLHPITEQYEGEVFDDHMKLIEGTINDC